MQRLDGPDGDRAADVDLIIQRPAGKPDRGLGPHQPELVNGLLHQISAVHEDNGTTVRSAVRMVLPRISEKVMVLPAPVGRTTRLSVAGE